MIGTVTTATRAAAPFIGKAAVAGTQAVVGMAVAARATRYANTRIHSLLDDLTEGREAAREATETTDTPVKAVKTA